MAERVSTPPPFDGLGAHHGVGVVARRTTDPVLSGLRHELRRVASQVADVWQSAALGQHFAGDGVLGPWSALQHVAETAPLHLLRLLIAQDGTASFAQSIDAGIAFGPSKVRLVALKDYRDGRGTIDPDGTAELERVLARYRPGTDHQDPDQRLLSLQGAAVSPLLPILLHTAQRLNDTGQAFFEAVGDPVGGVTQIVDFDPLTCRYRDASIPGRPGMVRLLEQRNPDAKEDERRGQVEGWRVLEGPGIVEMSWYASTDNPYGQPRYGAALPYLLRKLARRRDFSDWLHNTAFPKVVVEQSISEMLKMAASNPDLLVDRDGNEITPTEWVATQQAEIRKKLRTMLPDDFWMIGEGKAYAINPSDIAGLVEVLKMDRLEEIQSLDQLPALVGVTDGGTQAYAEAQWMVKTDALALFRAYCCAPAVAIGNAHFRLLGEDLVAHVEMAPVPPINRLAFSQARTADAALAEHLAAIGVNSPDDFASEVSGSAASDPQILAEYLASRRAPEPAPAPNPDPATQP